MPTSPHGRNQWRRDLTELTASLCLYHGAGSINAAMDITPSDAAAFFQSSAYDKHRAWIESGDKVRVAIVDRLNSVIRAIGIVAKRI